MYFLLPIASCSFRIWRFGLVLGRINPSYTEDLVEVCRL